MARIIAPFSEVADQPVSSAQPTRIFAPFTEEADRQVDPEQEEFANTVNLFRMHSVDEVVSALGGNEGSLLDFYNRNQRHIESDEVAREKFLDAFIKVRTEDKPAIDTALSGLKAGVEGIKAFGKGAVDTITEIGGAALAPSTAIDRAQRLAASTETAATQLAELGSNIVNLDPEAGDRDGWKSELIRRTEWRREIDRASRGKAAFREGTILERGKEFTPEEAEKVQSMSAFTDLTNLIPGGAAAKAARAGAAGKAIIPAAVKAGARSAAAATTEGVGKGLVGLSKVPSKLGFSSIGRALVGEAVATAHGLPGAAAGTFLSAKTAEAFGKSLIKTADKIRGKVPPGPLWNAISAVGRVAKSPARGAAAGLGLTGDIPAGLLTAATVVGAETPEDAIASLATNAAVGAVVGPAVDAYQGVKTAYQGLGSTLFGASAPAGSATSPAYGSSPSLDAAHTAAISALAPEIQGQVNKFREAFRGEAEIYVVDPDTYGGVLVRHFDEQARAQTGEPLTPEQVEAIANGEAGTKGVFLTEYTTPDGQTRKAVFMNRDGGALQHESGHLIDNLFTPEQRAEIREAVANSYPAEELAKFRKEYESRIDRKLTDEQVLDEVIAENISALLHNVPIEQFGTPAPVSRRLSQFVAGLAEKVGAKFGEQFPTELGLRPSVAVNRIAEANIRAQQAGRVPPASATPFARVAPAPAPAAPAPATPAPTPTPAPAPAPATAAAPASLQTPAPVAPAEVPNIRVTREQQNQFATPAAGERGAAPRDTGSERVAPLVPEDKQAIFQTLDAEVVKDPTQAGPVEVVYQSVKSEKKGAGRGERRAEQQAAYEAVVPEGTRAAAQKIFVPGSWTVMGGAPTLRAFSLDKILGNVGILIDAMVKGGVTDRIPYATQNGKLTTASAAELVRDIQTYAANQAAGYGGGGQRLTVPEGYYGTIPAEQPGARAASLPENRMQFINTIMGTDLGPPKTARVDPSRPVPANISAQQLAEANVRPMAPSTRSGEVRRFGEKFGERPIMDTNTFRQSLRDAGIKAVDDLLEVTENLNLSKIESVTPRTDLSFSRPQTDIVRAGFLPADRPRAQFLYEQSYRTKDGVEKTVRYYQTPGTPDNPRGLTVEEPTARDMGLLDEGPAAPAEEVSSKASFMPSDEGANATRGDFTREGVSGIHQRKNWAIFTAENPNGKQLPANINEMRQQLLREDLQAKGLQFIDPSEGTVGRYNSIEHPFVVFGISPAEAHRLGNKYQQDSIVIPDGLLYKDRTLERATGEVELHETAPTDLFTQLPDGTMFTSKIDFSERTPFDLGTTDTKPAKAKPAKNTEHAVGGTLDAVHFSSRSGLTETDPAFHGKGAATPTDLRGDPKTYFFEEGSATGADSNLTKNKDVYTAKIDGSTIYDGVKDPLGWATTPNRAEADAMLKDLGYKGILRRGTADRNVIAMFDKQPVEHIGYSDTEMQVVDTSKIRRKAMTGASFLPDTQTGELDLGTTEQSSTGPSRTRFSTVDIIGAKEPIAALGKKPDGAVDIGRKLAERTRSLANAEGTRFDETSRSDKAKRAMAESLADELIWAERNLSGETSGRGWYEKEVAKAIDIATKKFPELGTDKNKLTYFLGLLAITSNGQKVVPNAERAVKLYSEVRDTGKLDTTSSWGGPRKEAINTGLAQLDTLFKTLGEEKAREFLNAEFTVGELEARGFEIGGETKDTVVNGSAIFGPKIGAAFFQNLHGNFNPFTMDLWFSRTMNRHNGSYGRPDAELASKNLTRVREELRAAGRPEADFSDRSLKNWATKEEANIQRRFQKKEVSARKPYEKAIKALVEAGEGAYDSPRSAGERNWWRSIFSEVDAVLAERGENPINNADKQAILWYYEKELYSRLGGRKSDLGVSYGKAMQKAVDSLGATVRKASQSTIDFGTPRARNE